MDKELVLNIAYYYVITVAKSKPYNIQMKAILNEFNNKSIDINSYIETFETFNNNNEAFICKDFVYKNNLATYRKFYIASPSLYLYYTFQVFELYFDITKNIFNSSNIDIYYSGIVKENFKEIKENCDFNNQYEKYKKKKVGSSLCFCFVVSLVIDKESKMSDIGIEDEVNRKETTVRRKEKKDG